MASNKLVVFLCIAALATCGQAKSPAILSEAELGDIFDVAADLLDNLANTVAGVVDTALGTVDGLVQQLTSAADTLIKTLTGTLNGVVQTLIDQVNALAKAASDKGLDPAACVGTSLSDLTALPTTAINQVTQCVTAKVADTTKIIDEKVNVITSALTDVTQIGVNINNCRHKSFLLQPICVTQVTADIALKVVSLPAKVTNAVASLLTIVPKNIAGLAACEVGVVGDVTSKGGSIVQKVADCIAKL